MGEVWAGHIVVGFRCGIVGGNRRVQLHVRSAGYEDVGGGGSSSSSGGSSGSSGGGGGSGEGWMNEADIEYIFISRILDFLLHFSVHLQKCNKNKKTMSARTPSDLLNLFTEVWFMLREDYSLTCVHPSPFMHNGH